VTTLFLAVLYFRTDISVDPRASYDDSDPFSERFTITNNGPIHFATFITLVPSLRRKQMTRKSIRLSNESSTVMIPFTPNIPKIEFKEKTSTDCDFILKFGPELKSVRIFINVFYRLWSWKREFRTSGYKFSARRDATGRFLWDYGSPDIGPFDEDKYPQSR
jgi:hypothetical protein